MEESQKNKLIALLKERSKKIESIRNFNEYFERFTRIILKKAVVEVNDVLYEITQENLKLFLDNPYENSSSRYFAMVQIFYDSNRRNTFLLDNTKNFPALIFEGDEMTGKIKVSRRVNHSVSSSEIEITQLSEAKTFDILINFIDNIYKL